MPADVKQQITDALLQLLDKKSLEKITVRELAELCGISRQTFYYHFGDVFDVVDWWSRQSAEQMHCGPHGPASNFRRCRFLTGQKAAEKAAASSEARGTAKGPAGPFGNPGALRWSPETLPTLHSPSFVFTLAPARACRNRSSGLPF